MRSLDERVSAQHLIRQGSHATRLLFALVLHVRGIRQKARKSRPMGAHFSQLSSRECSQLPHNPGRVPRGNEKVPAGISPPLSRSSSGTSLLPGLFRNRSINVPDKLSFPSRASPADIRMEGSACNQIPAWPGHLGLLLVPVIGVDARVKWYTQYRICLPKSGNEGGNWM
jgi:hypothetical protein